jgi:ATP-dependent Clp protease ATP-binding subunit ClpA
MNWFNGQQPVAHTFDPACSVVLRGARDAANARNEVQVTTAHMVTGLLLAQDATVVAMLTACGIDAKPGAAASARPGKGDAELPFNRKARRAIELAMEAARAMNHGSVQPGHLLLGVLREGGVGARVLLETGADEGKFIEALAVMLSP